MKFSSRLSDSYRPNRLTELLQQKRTNGVSIIDLTLANPTTAGFDYPYRAIAAALAAAGHHPYTPDPLGLDIARAAIVDYYAERGWHVSPEQILLTASTSEAYGFLLQLLCDPGDSIWAPQPSYPLFDLLGQLARVRVSRYPLIEDRIDGWRVGEVDWEDKTARAIISVEPNNPTGTVLTSDDWTKLLTFSAQRQMPMIVDTVFADYADPSARIFERLADLNDRPAFVLSGLSKVVGLPQLKLSWIVTTGPANDRERVLSHLSFIADTYLTVAGPVQHALPALVMLGRSVRQQIQARIQRNRITLADLVASAGLRLLPTAGGWTAVCELPQQIDDEAFVIRLLEIYDCLIHPGYFYDFQSERMIVVSLLSLENEFDSGIERIRRCLCR